MAGKSEKDFYQKGFLGNQITEVTEAILKKHQPFFDTCYKVNELAYMTFFETKPNNQDLQQLLAITLFIRILNGFQSIVVLARLGLAFDAKVVLRGVLESLFIEKFLCEEKDFALEYVKSDECSRLKWLNIARKSAAPHFNLLREIATDEEVEKLKKKIDQQGCKEIAVEEVADGPGFRSNMIRATESFVRKPILSLVPFNTLLSLTARAILSNLTPTPQIRIYRTLSLQLFVYFTSPKFPCASFSQ